MLARGAHLSTLDDTETLVKHTTGNGVVALMRLICHDLNNRPPEDLLGRHDAKLNAYNRHCILISLSRNIFGDPFLPNISVLCITKHGMSLLKVRLTEDQIREYRQPENTRNPECGGGINCVFCALKMLGIYDADTAAYSDMCMPRFRIGNIIKTDEHLPVIEKAIEKVEGKAFDFSFKYEYGTPEKTLVKIANELPPGYACFLIYGNRGVGTHAVVLRCGDDGVMELIDPQRGLSDINGQYGFKEARARELGIEVTENYYRVKGSNIPAAMVDQSLLFKYWTSKDDLLKDLSSNFVIGTLLIGGEKMDVDEYLEKVQQPIGVKRAVPPPPAPFEGAPLAKRLKKGGEISVTIKRGPTRGGFVLSPLGQKMLAEEPSKGVILFYIVSHAKVELLSDASLYGFIYKATLNPGIPSPVYKHDFTTCACKDPGNLSCEPKSMKAPPNVLARPCFQEVRHFIFKISFLSKEPVTFSIYNRNGQPTRKRTDTVDGFRKESHIQYDLYDSKFLAGEPIIPPVLFREPLLRPLETSDGIELVKQFPGLDAHVSAAVKAGTTEVGMTMMQSAEGYKTLGEILADPTESLESKASSVAHARYAFYVLALEYGYSQGDSHTYNVMISDDIGQFASSTVPGNYSRGKVFIIDFGRARKIDFSQDPHTMTPTEVLYDVALEGLGQLAGQRDWLWNNAEDFLIHLPLGDVDNDIRAIAEKFAMRIDTISPAFASNPNLKTFDPVQGAVHQYNELIPRTLAPMLDRGVAARVVGAPGAPALPYGKGRMTISVKRRSRSKRNARIPRK